MANVMPARSYVPYRAVALLPLIAFVIGYLLILYSDVPNAVMGYLAWTEAAVLVVGIITYGLGIHRGMRHSVLINIALAIATLWIVPYVLFVILVSGMGDLYHT
ncbi:MAG: hypothetical protein ABIR47_16610 [Candidatus Kapaibacterium sp.]